MAEDEDLQLLRATRPPQQPYQREQVPDNEIHERPEQTALPRTTTTAPNLATRRFGEPRTSLRTLRALYERIRSQHAYATASAWLTDLLATQRDNAKFGN